MFRKLTGNTHKLEEELRERGRRAPADVVDTVVTGSISSGSLAMQTQAICKLSVQVQPSGETAFPAEIKQRFNQFGIPTPGTRVEVLYDPSDHDKIVVATDTASVMTVQGGSVGDLLQRAMADPQQFRQEMLASAGASPAPPAEDDSLAQLERLAALHANGALTDAEFQAQKRRLLGT
jgi:hypothetical protein